MTLGRTPAGDCHFHRDSRCALQVAGGEGMLPGACRHFPRVLLLDGRGCLLTLSHYCPTAAGLLLDGGGIEIVEAAPPLALAPPLEGLDARDALPPLLRPGMLMDVPSYGTFEAACLRTLAAADDAGAGLRTIAAAVERIRTWSPGTEPLAACVENAFGAAAARANERALSSGFRLAAALTGPHPWMKAPPDLEDRWDALVHGGGEQLAGIVTRYMAATTFGNWMPYRGQGLRTVVEWLRACYDVLRLQLVREVRENRGISRRALIEAVRASDYLVVHTVDSLAFGRAAVGCEQQSLSA